MDFIIKDRDQIDARAASALVQHSFNVLSASDWEQSARDKFLADTAPGPLAEKIGLASYCAAAFTDSVMTGFVLMPTPTLVGLLFVHPDWLRHGIGRLLWSHARSQVEAEYPAVKTVELNSTPYALGFYRSIGFVPISRQFELAGHRAIRMACWLPARAFGAEITPKND